LSSSAIRAEAGWLAASSQAQESLELDVVGITERALELIRQSLRALA
jgi:hypothetical protein